MEVYADVMFLVNMQTDAVLLCVSAIAARRRVKIWRVLAASALASLVATVLFFFDLNTAVRIAVSVAVAWITVAVCFAAVSPLKILKPLFLFLFFSLIFYALCSVVGSLTAVPVFSYNGAVYMDISQWYLLLLTGAGLVISFVYVKVTGDKNESSLIYRLEIESDGKKLQTNALFDTGNKATDFISNLPVIILEKESAAVLLGEGIMGIYNGERYNLSVMAEKKLRYIPYGGVWSETGILPCFHPNKITVISPGGKRYESDAVVGITDTKLSLRGEYSALIGGAVFQ